MSNTPGLTSQVDAHRTPSPDRRGTRGTFHGGHIHDRPGTPQALRHLRASPALFVLGAFVAFDVVGSPEAGWALVAGGLSGPVVVRAAVVEALIDAGVSTGAQRDRIPYVPLVLAATCGHTDVVDVLLDRGADIEDRDFKGRSPLEWAVSFGQPATVRLLLRRGAEPTEKALASAREGAERCPERAGDRALVLRALEAARAEGR
ncbi:ankyrin repeat domain-containing protein [Streptomyces griseoincarnatus]